jgi:hypothetical protein
VKEHYDWCPVCKGPLKKGESIGNLVAFNCNNEKEIIFAKARQEPIPEYHSFSYERKIIGFPELTVRWMLQFPVSPKKIVRLIRRSDINYTVITDRYGMELITIDQPLEPDFPDLTKLKNKIKTYMTFS